MNEHTSFLCSHQFVSNLTCIHVIRTRDGLPCGHHCLEQNFLGPIIDDRIRKALR